MDTVIKVMDLDVNIMDSDTFNKKIEEYLENDQLNILLLATSRLLVEVAEREDFREMISSADLVLPAEEALLGMYPKEAVEKNGVIVDHQCLSELMGYLSREKDKESAHESYTLYMVGNSEKELQIVADFFEYSGYGISVVGGRMEQEFEDELIINEINGLAPDILLVALDTPRQEEWVMEHRTRVNTKLCVGLGGMIHHMVAGYGRVPGFLYTLHLDGIYRRFVLDSSWMKKRERERLKKKVKEYKDKKREQE